MPAVLNAAHTTLVIHTRESGGHLVHTASAFPKASRLQNIRSVAPTLFIVSTGPSSYRLTGWLLHPPPVPGAAACLLGSGPMVQVIDPAWKTLGWHI